MLRKPFCLFIGESVGSDKLLPIISRNFTLKPLKGQVNYSYKTTLTIPQCSTSTEAISMNLLAIFFLLMAKMFLYVLIFLLRFLFSVDDQDYKRPLNKRQWNNHKDFDHQPHCTISPLESKNVSLFLTRLQADTIITSIW